MNKEQALAFLKENGYEIGLRTLERHTSAGKIASTKVKGKTGKVADYTEEALLAYKASEEALTGSVIDPPAPAIKAPPRQVVPALSAPANPATGALSRLPFQGQQQIEKVRQSPLALAKATPDPPRISEKILWTLEEAALMTGIAKGRIRSAIDNGELRGGLVGRSFKVAPEEVKKWALKLF